MNKVMLIGNVGKDPDIHYFEADQAVAQVSLATTEKGYTSTQVYAQVTEQKISSDMDKLYASR